MTKMLELLEKNIKTPSGVVICEVELMRFFTTISTLRLGHEQTIFNAYEKLVYKLQRTN